MRRFKPFSTTELSKLNLKETPYISLAKIICLQLRREPNFLVEDSEMIGDEVAGQPRRPVLLVRRNGLYDVWILNNKIMESVSGKQALFVFATLNDVLGLSPSEVRQLKVSKGYNLSIHFLYRPIRVTISLSS